MTKITIKDIGKIAGVSPTTVSKVIRNQPGVSEEKRKEIIEIAKKFRFYPNRLAKNLKLKKTDTIGLVFENLDPIYASLVVNIERELREKNYTLIFGIYKGGEEFKRNIDNFFMNRVDGIISGPVFYKHQMEVFNFLKFENLPFVIFGNIEFLDCDFVTIEREKTIEKIVDYLAKKGKRKFAYLSTPHNEISYGEKLRGFENGLKKNGLKIYENLIIYGDGKIETGYKKMKEILESNSILPDAIICHNDFVAIGAIKAIKEKGLKIPEDISVVGFDGIEEGEFILPPLTTIKQPIDKISKEVVRLLLERIKNPKKEYERIILEPEIIIRGTT